MPFALVLCLAARLGAQEAGPLTLVAPAAPGGGWDQLARAMQRVLEAERLTSRAQVENIPGAAGTVGLARFVSSRRGDPSALLVTGLVMIGGAVQNASPVTLRDATPIARLVGEYEVIAVPAQSPLQTLGDLLRLFREDPGAVSWGGGSAGGTDQILVDLVARAVGVDVRRVNYVAFSGGGEARTALLGAQVTAGVSGLGEFAELSAAGRVRILAVSAPRRLAGWDVPTLREAGVEVTLANWRGVMAAPGLRPLERVALEGLVERMARSRSWRTELQRRGWENLWLSGDAFGRLIESETRRVEDLAALRGGVALDAPKPGRTAGIGGLPVWLGLGLVLCLGLVVRPAGHREKLPLGSWPRTGLVAGGLIANAALSHLAGFVPASVVLFVATAVALRAERPGRVLLVAVGFCLAVFVLFRAGLRVPLPVGSWWAGSG